MIMTSCLIMTVISTPVIACVALCMHPGRPHTAREAVMAGIAPARDFGKHVGKFPAATRVLRRTVPGRTRARITVSRERTHWGHVNGPG